MEEYAVCVEIIYMGFLRVKAEDSSEAMEKAFQIMDKMRIGKDMPESVGDSDIYFGDLRLDNVEYGTEGEFIANLNLQYVGEYKVFAEDPEEADMLGREQLEIDGIPESFGIFELDMKSIYDVCLMA